MGGQEEVVAEGSVVDDERIRGAPQPGMARDPAVDATQPIGAGGAARHLPDGGSAGRHEPMMPGRAQHPPVGIMAG